MTSKEKLKENIHNQIDKMIDGIEIVGDLNFFEILTKCTNGKLTFKQSTTYKTDEK